MGKIRSYDGMVTREECLEVDLVKTSFQKCGEKSDADWQQKIEQQLRMDWTNLMRLVNTRTLITEAEDQLFVVF